jgi:hypothetical protein
MTILTEADKSAYFPSVTQTSVALQGLIYVTQALCEGSYGANRPLEQQTYTEIVDALAVERFAYLSRYPVVSLSEVQVRRRLQRYSDPFMQRISSRDTWGRQGLLDWITLTSDQYLLDIETGRLNFYEFATEARVTYVSGFDFGGSDQTARQIKAIAGVVLTYMANNYYGGLNSHLINPATGTAENFNYATIDRYLEVTLSPLKRYIPRRSGG